MNPSLDQKADSEQSTSEDKMLVSPPSISLPKGGGAIRGVGEKFSVNPVTGTGSLNVPIAVSPGRSGFGPQLNLAYDSGSGNGPFGWSLLLPAITRKTDKGLPQYLDAGESDVYILSGAEDLMPVLIQNAQGEWTREKLPLRSLIGVPYRVDRYHPRIEGLFARIERWTNTSDAKDIFWRAIYICVPSSSAAVHDGSFDECPPTWRSTLARIFPRDRRKQ